MVVPLLPGPPGFRDRPVCGIGTGPASGLQNGDPTAGRRHWHGDCSPREQRPSVILRAYFAGGQTDGLKDRRMDLQCPFRRSHRRTACPAQPPLARLRHEWTRSWLSPEVAWGQRRAAPSPTRTVQRNLEPPMLRTDPWNWLHRPWGSGNWPFPDYEHVTWGGEGHGGKAQLQVS